MVARHAVRIMRFAVILFAGTVLGGDALAYTASQTQNQTSAGQDMTFSFTNLPLSATDLTVSVMLWGDYNNTSTKYAQVWIDDVAQTSNASGTNYCSSSGNGRNYSGIPASTIATDRRLDVRVDLSAAVGLPCGSIVERVEVKVNYLSAPDLTMDLYGVDPVTTVGSGSPLTITFTVKNGGETASGAFPVSFYYGDDTSTTNLTPLATVDMATLAGGKTSATQTRTVNLPANVLNGKRYIHSFVDPSNAVAEGEEGNNRGYVYVTLTGRPDFQVTTLSLDPSSQVANGKVTVSYRVKNLGTTRAEAASLLRFFYSDDWTIETTDTNLNADVTVPAGLEAGASHPATADGTVTVTVPSNAIAGPRYIGAYADVNNAVNEGTNEANNTQAPVLTVLAPNLVMSTWTAPASAQGYGSKIPFSFVVKNSGKVSAGAFTVTFFYADNTTFNNDPSRVTLGSYAFPGGLDAYQSTPNTSLTVTLPNSVTYGGTTTPRYLFYYIDFEKVVPETLENDNMDRRDFFITGLPDLVVSELAVAPGQVAAGLPVTVTYKFANIGYSRVYSQFSTQFYLSPDATITTGDTNLNQSVSTQEPPAGESVSGSKSVTIPASATPGDQFLGAIANHNYGVVDSNPNNNARSVALKVTPPLPDLKMSTWQATTSSPGYNNTLSVTYQIQNAGTADSGGFILTFYYADTDSMSDPTRVALGNGFAVPSLAPGSSTPTGTATLTLPASVLYGTRYLSYAIDSANAVTELDETNNQGSRQLQITGLPDLQVASLVPNPTQVAAGGSVSLAYQVRNTGLSRLPAPVTTRFYESADATIATSDTYLNKEVETATLKAGATATGNAVVVIPANTATGDRFLGAIVDYNGLVSESSESNNTASVVYKVVPAQMDLQMKSFTAPASADGYKSDLLIEFAVKNVGTAATPVSKLNIYYGDTTDTANLVLLKTYSVSALYPGTTSATYTYTLTLPGTVLFGARYLHYFIDPDNAIVETDEKNNRGTSALQITGLPDLRPTKMVVKTASQIPGEFVSVTCAVANEGLSRVPGATTRFYYSADDAITTGDTYVVPEYSFSNLAAGASTGDKTFSVTVPGSAQVGTRYIGAIADYDNAVTESSETNNALAGSFTVIAAQPDLQGTLALDGQTFAGHKTGVPYRFVVTNPGPVESGPFVVALGYNETAAPGGMSEMAVVPVASIPAKGSFTYPSPTTWATATLPASVVSGGGFAVLVVDSASQAGESNEDNNVASAPLTITGKPDLQVTGLAATPGTQVQGGPVTVTYQVFNAGEARATGPFKVRFYYSADATVTTSDLWLDVEKSVAGLDAQGTTPADGPASVDLVLPTSAEVGDRYVGAIVDFDGLVAESAEDNNAGATQVVVRRDLGQACDQDGECFADHCVDGVCCESACGGGVPGDCQACNLGKPGQCELVPADTLCRPMAEGGCDVAETCTGWSDACPTDGFEPDSEVCRPAAGPCDVEEHCSGAGPACVDDAFLPASTTCREPAGECDVEERCTGASAACPEDAVQPHTEVCRPEADKCDDTESCTGFGTDCPADGFLPTGTRCRDANGECDVAEDCDGQGAVCPVDRFVQAGAPCGSPDETVCDHPDTCDGIGKCATNFSPDTVECRPAATVCDVAENCDGTGACPADVLVPDDSVCSDSDACTREDRCLAGVCVPAGPTDCADGNPCTRDTCDKSTGCANPPQDDGTPCLDTDVCNGSESCVAGTCSAGKALDCDDSNPCTADACDGLTGCHSIPEADGLPCLDADVCNGSESCIAGTCSEGPALDCDDSNPCTIDSCDAEKGCLNPDTADGTLCLDADLCNGSESCLAGQCQAGQTLVCDDANPCTNDTCEPALGCGHSSHPDGLACDDQDLCNGREACLAGVCATGSPLVCTDGEVCTDDVCDAGLGCLFPVNEVACDDGDACTASDACKAGTCAGTTVDCDDQEPCTLDSCVPATGCSHVAAEDCCSAGYPCKAGFACEGDMCVLKLCLACQAPEDCGLPGAQCTAFVSGDYCTVPCEDACPEGYACTGKGEDGKGLCTPDKGDCVCETPEKEFRCEGQDWVRLDDCGHIVEVVESCANGCIDGTGCCPAGTRVEEGACVPVATDASETFEDTGPVPDEGGADLRDSGTAETEEAPEASLPDVLSPGEILAGDETATSADLPVAPAPKKGGGCAANGWNVGGPGLILVLVLGAVGVLFLRRSVRERGRRSDPRRS